MSEHLADVRLERLALGSFLLRPETMLSSDLTEDDFSVETHRYVWRALIGLAADGEPIDSVRAIGRLQDMGRINAVGGPEFVLELTDTIPQTNLPFERLKDKTRLRALRAAALQVIADCNGGELDRATASLANLHGATLTGQRRSSTMDLYELCDGILDELEQRIDGVPLIHLGYDLLDHHFGSLPIGSTLSVLAATNVGKSYYTLEVLIRAATRGTKVGYISVEDQLPVVRARVASMFSAVSSKKILQRRVEQADIANIARSMSDLDAMRALVHVSILQGATENQVCAAMSELAMRGCKLIAVDYLQKIRSSSRNVSDTKAQRTADVASQITSHGQRLGVATILVSQRGRPERGKENDCPTKHDMKESGDLENMVDGIIGLWRQYEDDFAPVYARILKAKSGGNGMTWRLQRSGNGARLHEVPGSDSRPRNEQQQGSYTRGNDE